MKIFKEFNLDGPPCPECGTTKQGETVLIPIYGSNTKKNPMEYEAVMMHFECFDPVYVRGKHMIVQKFPDETLN